jgi:hypothetical protein
MIEDAIRWRSIRRAKIAFWIAGAGVAATTAVIGSAIIDPARAVVYGIIAGLGVGFLVGLTLFCWPAIRVAWHWSAELLTFGGLLAAYLYATTLMPWWAAITLLVLTTGGPVLVPALRRRLWPLVMCAVTRHRLRVCFTAFIASQRSGMGPLILLARPIPAGERVWIWLRPGLALADIEQRLDRLAAGCWAAECRIAPASRRYAALLRIDIGRRNPLVGMVGTELATRVPATVGRTGWVDLDSVTGLDLPEIPTPAALPAEPATKPRKPAPAGPVVDDNTPADVPEADDLSLWI